MSLSQAIARWDLSDATQIADTATSTVFKAFTAAREPVALKILKPYGIDEMRGVRLLDWYDGDGAVRVIDCADAMIVLEWLEGETLGDVVRAGDDAVATDILCAVVGRLPRARSTHPQGLQPVALYLDALFAADPSRWPQSSHGDLVAARRLAHRLLETAPAPVPLHGDLHHDNIMGSSRGWLAIDPKGVWGDPAYEVADVFRNPAGTGEMPADPDRIGRLADALSVAMGQDRYRILEWAAVHAAVSICWSQAAGSHVDWNSAILPNLLEAADTARQMG